VLLSLRLDRMQAGDRTQLLNNLAVAEMEAGDPSEAIAIAKRSLDCAPAGTPSDELAINAATLGEALVRAGRHAEALPVLEDALSRVRRKSDRARAALYLGDALAGLGRKAEAAEAYRRACSEYPAGRSAMHAGKRLADLDPYRS
jgi:tetratricopeptide (TPR) repeat protein